MRTSAKSVKKILSHKPIAILMGHNDSPDGITNIIKQAAERNYKAVGYEFDEKLGLNEYKQLCEQELQIGSTQVAKYTESLLRNNAVLSKQNLETWLCKYNLDKDLIKNPSEAYVALGEAILMTEFSLFGIEQYVDILKAEHGSDHPAINEINDKSKLLSERAPGLMTSLGFRMFMNRITQNLMAMQNARTQLAILNTIQQLNLAYCGMDPVSVEERRQFDNKSTPETEEQREKAVAEKMKKIILETQGGALFIFGIHHGIGLQSLLKDWEYGDQICWVTLDQLAQAPLLDQVRLDIRYRAEKFSCQFPAGLCIVNCDQNNVELEKVLQQKRLSILTVAIKEIIAVFKTKFADMPVDSYPQQTLAKLTLALESKNPFKAVNLILRDISAKSGEDANLRNLLTPLFEQLREVLWDYICAKIGPSQNETLTVGSEVTASARPTK